MSRVGYLTIVLIAALTLATSSANAQVIQPAPGQIPAGQYASIALDPAASGVSAVNAAADMLKSQSPEAAISYFNEALDSTKNSAVARMIRFRLVELYKQANRPDKALEVLKDIIALTPQVAAPSSQVIQIVPASAENGANGAQQ